MLFYEFNVGEKTYKLRLNTRNVVSLEQALGCNPLSIFGDGNRLPTVGEMVAILKYSLQQYQHNITNDAAMEIFDAWLEDGHAITDFVMIIMEIYKVSGIVPKDAGEDNEKNA